MDIETYSRIVACALLVPQAENSVKSAHGMEPMGEHTTSEDVWMGERGSGIQNIRRPDDSSGMANCARRKRRIRGLIVVAYHEEGWRSVREWQGYFQKSAQCPGLCAANRRSEGQGICAKECVAVGEWF